MRSAGEINNLLMIGRITINWKNGLFLSVHNRY